MEPIKVQYILLFFSYSNVADWSVNKTIVDCSVDSMKTGWVV